MLIFNVDYKLLETFRSILWNNIYYKYAKQGIYIIIIDNSHMQPPRYQNEGRSVNLAGGMFKRKAIFNPNIKDDQNSPFENYSCKSLQPSLSESENSIFEGTLTSNSVPQLVKEQLEKSHGPQEANKKQMLILQAQMNDLKQLFVESKNENTKKVEQAMIDLRRNFQSQVQKIGKEVQYSIANKLKSLFQILNIELKKDILNTVEGQFLTIVDAQNLGEQLQTLNQKIDDLKSLNPKSKPVQIQQKMERQLVLLQQTQTKVINLQKEFGLNKRQTSQILNKMIFFQEWKQQETRKRTQTILQQKIESIRQKIKRFEEQMLEKISNFLLIHNETQKSNIFLKQKLVQIQKYNEEQNNRYFDLSNKLATELQQFKQGQSKKDLVLSQKQVEVTFDLTNIKNQDKAREQAQVTKQVYQIDFQGYLMDGERKYLLTDDNQMIRLEQQHIKILLSSKEIQIIEE